MNSRLALSSSCFFQKLSFFFALSRTPHGLIDMTTPMFAACLWLGYAPPLSVTILGLITVFAGYTAVYALNDVVDYRLDRERLRQEGYDARTESPDLDAAMVRHPMAQGLLSFGEGLAWALGWSVVAVVGAWSLNPFCVWIFLSGCLLEAIYCMLFRVSPLRTFINGIVKTLGALAAVFAVDPSPSPLFLVTLFFMLFLWEIGGQNIPNDSMDIEEDIKLRARTIPIRFGLEISGYACVTTLLGTAFLTVVLFSLFPARFGHIDHLTLIGIGLPLLILPAWRFYQNPSEKNAMTLFNRASYYPLSLFGIVLLNIVTG